MNIVRLYNDYAEDENFWHDGAWPPYDEQDMAELGRVIATCHQHNIRVLPYFSIHEFHPKAHDYKKHEPEWKRSMDEAGTVYHNSVGKDRGYRHDDGPDATSRPRCIANA